jgi:hypothetical protein
MDHCLERSGLTSTLAIGGFVIPTRSAGDDELSFPQNRGKPHQIQSGLWGSQFQNS